MTAYKNLDDRINFFINHKCQYIISPYDEKIMQHNASARFSVVDLNKEFCSNVQFERDRLNDRSWISPLPEIRADLYEFSIGQGEDAYNLEHALETCQNKFFEFLKDALLTDLNDRLIRMEGG